MFSLRTPSRPGNRRIRPVSGVGSYGDAALYKLTCHLCGVNFEGMSKLTGSVHPPRKSPWQVAPSSPRSEE